MKTALDPRHRKRQKLVEELFKVDFYKQSVSPQTKKIIAKKDFIDKRIQKAAPQYPIDKINKIDLAILRLSFFELLVEKKEPPKVIIDEAIELAKEYGGSTSPSFINGAVATLKIN